MPDDIRELRHPDFYGLQLAEQPVTQGARIARNVDTWKHGLLSKRPGLRRMNHRQYAGQITAIADIQRICDYGKFLVLSGFGAGGEIFEHQQPWVDPTPPGFAGPGPWGGGGGGGSGGGDDPEPPFSENWPPIAIGVASANVICVGVPVFFSGDASWDPDGGIASYLWDFGDGNTSALPNPSHTYAAAGNYVVTFAVTDDEGLSATDVPIAIEVIAVGFTTWQITASPRSISFAYDEANKEVAAFYTKTTDVQMIWYMQVWDLSGNVVTAEVVVFTGLGWAPGPPNGVMRRRAVWDGTHYGLLTTTVAGSMHLLRIARNGAVISGPLAIAGTASSVALGWNGTHYCLIRHAPLGVGTEFARATAACVLVGGWTAIPNVAGWGTYGDTDAFDILSDGVDWMVVYDRSIGGMGIRVISAAGVLGPELTFGFATATLNLPMLGYNGAAFAVSYAAGVNAVWRTVDKTPAFTSAEHVLVALPISRCHAFASREDGWIAMYSDAGAPFEYLTQRASPGGATYGVPIGTGINGPGWVLGYAGADNQVIFSCEYNLAVGTCLGD